jgi:hypothetical protein
LEKYQRLISKRWNCGRGLTSSGIGKTKEGVIVLIDELYTEAAQW